MCEQGTDCHSPLPANSCRLEREREKRKTEVGVFVRDAARRLNTSRCCRLLLSWNADQLQAPSHPAPDIAHGKVNTPVFCRQRHRMLLGSSSRPHAVPMTLVVSVLRRIPSSALYAVEYVSPRDPTQIDARKRRDRCCPINRDQTGTPLGNPVTSAPPAPIVRRGSRPVPKAECVISPWPRREYRGPPALWTRAAETRLGSGLPGRAYGSRRGGRACPWA